MLPVAGLAVNVHAVQREQIDSEFAARAMEWEFSRTMLESSKRNIKRQLSFYVGHKPVAL